MKEALKLALYELEGIPVYRKYGVRISNAITAIKEALAQPEQEPVAFISPGGHIHYDPYLDSVPLYTAPPKRPWVGLTAQEAADCWTTSATQTWHKFEAKLKEKNT
jgi:hypothetical protein